MKLSKRLLSLVLCLAMLLTMVPATVFAEEFELGGNVGQPDYDAWGDSSQPTDPGEPTTVPDSTTPFMNLTVEASTTQVRLGDTVEYTVYAHGSDIIAMEFNLYVPFGMSFVSGSGEIPVETQELIAWGGMDWAAESMMWTGCNDSAVDFPEGTPILTFSCTADAEGTYEVQLADAYAYDSERFDLFANVTTDTVTVSGSQAADKTLYFNMTGSGWSQVYYYTWNGSGGCSGVWPGTAMTPVGGNVYSCQVPEAAQYIIFNNGDNGARTEDLTIPTDGSNLYRYSSSQWSVFDGVLPFLDYIAVTPSQIEVSVGDTVDYTVYAYGSGINMLEFNLRIPSGMTYVEGSGSIPPEVDMQLTDGAASWTDYDLYWYGYSYADGGFSLMEYTPILTFTCTVDAPGEYVVDTDMLYASADNYSLDVAYLPAETVFATGEIPTRTLYFDNTDTGWSEVYCCFWNDSNPEMSGWPGIPMTLEDGNIYSCQVPETAAYVLFGDGNSFQSIELAIPTDGSNMYSLRTASWSVYSSCDHSFTDYVSNNDATCTQDGTKTAACSICGVTRTVADEGSALGHLFDGEWEVQAQNTCTTDGLQTRNCSRCGTEGKDLLTENLPACTGSEYTNYMNRTFPAVAVEGAAKYVITLSASSVLENSYDYLYVYAQSAEGTLTQVDKCSGSIGGRVITVNAPAFVLKMTTDGSQTRYGFEVASVEVTYADAYQVLPATGHSYDAVVSDPTCTVQGFTAYTCSACGDSYTDDFVPALGHDLDPDAWVQTYEPSCARFGKEDNYCLRCGERQRRNVEMLPHTFSEEWTVVTPATCTEDGLEVRTCTACGAQGVSGLRETLHLPYLNTSEYVNNMNKVFPTVTVPGVDQLILHFTPRSELESNCDKLYIYAGDSTSASQVTYLTGSFGSQTVTVPGDTFTLRMTTDGSVTRHGFQVSTVTCYYTDCYRVLPATGHSYETTVTEATCTEDGYTTHTCSLCGDSYTDTLVAALGHDLAPDGWHETQTPTCVIAGISSNSCLRCGEEITEPIPALGHSYAEDWELVEEATCTKTGLETRYCTACGAQGVELLTDASLLPSCTGSSYTHNMSKTFPTVTVPGAVKLVVRFSSDSYLENSYDKLYVYAGDSVNSANLVRTLTGSFGPTTVTVEGDSFTLKMTTDGSVVRTGFRVEALECYYSDAYEILPVLGHDYSDWITVEEPDCENWGYREQVCSRCDDVIGEELENLGHQYGEWVTVQENTCTEDGWREQICDRCGGSNTETIEAPGHDFVYSETVPATCTADGAEISICSVCDEESRKVLPARHADLDNDDFCDHCGEPFVGVLDLVFVIDTTGSMGGEIDVVKRNISDYANRLSESNIPYYIAVVDYRDFADRAYSYDYPYSVVQDFTNDIDEILAGVDRLSLGNGGDTPETVYSGLMTGLDELSWGEGSVRKVILIGDAAPLDPEPYTGFELEQVTEHLNENGVSVYAVTTGNSYEINEFKQIAEQTGGSSYVCSTDSQFEQVMTDVIDSIPDSLHIHTYDESVTTATCTQGGTIDYTCTGCGKEITANVPALGHDHSEEFTVDAEPTCDVAGSQSRHCSRCDHKANVTEIPALGHEWGDWTRIQDPTCTLVGTEERTCSRCGGVDTQTVNALGHDLSTQWTVDAEPDCDTAGSQSHHCSRCDHKADVTEIPALGHEYGEWSRVQDPSCTEAGSEERICGRCGGVDTQTVAALGHELSTEWTVDAEPTCDKAGSQSHHCSRCGHKADVTEIPALGHEYGEWSLVQDPSCTEEGSEERICGRCGGVDTNTLPALEHDYVESSVDPDCENQGYILHTCSRCGDTYKDNYVDALGHSYGEWIHESDPTCTVEGADYQQCAVCKNKNYKSIAALGHTETSQVIDPDCVNRGYTLYTCQVCGSTRRDSYVNALGHSFGDWIVDKEATVLAKGNEHRVCSACGHTEKRDIPAIEIDISENSGYGLANFTVVNAQTLNPIRNAQIFISTLEDGENTFTTDANGQVSIVLPVGRQQVSVYASGCLTRNLNIVIQPGVNQIQQIGLSDKPTYDAEITSKEMTYEEIVDAGIDVTAPGNQHVYKYELQLNFEPEIDIDSIIAYFNSDGKYIGGVSPNPNPGPGDDDDDDDDEGSGSSTPPDPGPIRINKEVTVYPITEYFYLIIRGEITWLKEMFDVEMLVINNSQTDTLEDLTATLALPEGLSLADMVGEQQTLAQHIDKVAEGQSESVHWYVRGDSAGSYSLEARLQGMVMPFEEPIDDVFRAEDQIHVWAGNAMHLDFEFPDAAYYAEDYPIRITLTNVSDKPLYNVHHLVQVVQGMEIYYHAGGSKIRIDESNWNGVGVAVFNPGDKIIIESTVNIFFKSEVMEMKLQEMIGVVDNIEKLIKAYKVVKLGIDLVGGLFKCADEAVDALDDYIPKMINESVEKVKLVKELCEAIADLSDTKATTGDEKLDDILSVGETGVSTVLQVITSDPEDWVNGKNLDEIADLIEEVKGLKKSIEGKGAPGTRKFDLFDSLRTAISAIPVRYALASVVMTEDPNNTTSIPWSYTAYRAAPQYFGVSSVSKYVNALGTAVAAEVYDSAVPGFFMLIPGLDDPFGKEEAIRYIQATEDEIAKVKAKDATGKITFKAWVETKTRSAGTNILLSSDNETAYVDENGVLHFTGDGMIEILPKSLSGGVLYIEDSNGNLYTYNINVAPAHTHTEGSVEVIIPPMQGNNGFGAVLCEVCGDMIDVVELSAEACGDNHSYGEWSTLSEADCEACGMEVRTCSVCYANDYRYTDALGHSYETVSQAPTCTTDGFVTNTCTTCGGVETEVTPAPGHSWNEATCTVAKTCWVCGTVEGEALGHGHTLGTGLASNGNDTHSVICGDCGETLSTEPCVYDKQNHLCDCGAAFSGWYTDDQGTTYLYNGTMLHKQTMATIDGDTYYFDARGYIVKDIVSWNGDMVAMDLTTGKRLDGYQGIYTAADGEMYYVENAIAAENKGLVKVTLDDGHIHYYYFGCCEEGCGSDCAGTYKAQKNGTHRAYITNGLLMEADFTFDAEGVILHNADTSLQGINPDENGVDHYYQDGVKLPKGLFLGEDGNYYYANLNGKIIKGQTYYVTNTNGLTYNGQPIAQGSYTFDAEGALVFDAVKNGFYFENGGWYYYVDGELNYAGLIWCNGPEGDEPGYYYVNSKCMLITDCTYWISKNNGHMKNQNYNFDENGTMYDKNGFYFENGSWYYYVDNQLNYAGLIYCDGPEGNDPGYYYINTKCMLITDCGYWISKNNGHMKNKTYYFDENGTMYEPVVELKNGIVEEDGQWYYYVDGVRTYAGLILINGDYYYVNSKCVVVRDCTYWISKNNGYMKNQNYTFDENGKMVLN